MQEPFEPSCKSLVFVSFKGNRSMQNVRHVLFQGLLKAHILLHNDFLSV